MSPTAQSIFVSHATVDDAFVRRLQQAMADLGWATWIDSRELHGGMALEESIFDAIEACRAYIVVISAASLSSTWVHKELWHALQVRAQRGANAFPVIPVVLDNVSPGALAIHFGSEPIYVAARSEAGGIAELLPGLLAALGLASPAECTPTPPLATASITDWQLRLTATGYIEKDGQPRATALALLTRQFSEDDDTRAPSAAGLPFAAPLEIADLNDIRWYLQTYPAWPSQAFAARAVRIERKLQAWGDLLGDALCAAIPQDLRGMLLDDADGAKPWRVSICLPQLGARAVCSETQSAALALAALPWELLRMEGRFLRELGRHIGVRRVIPGTAANPVALQQAPVRILLVVPRPDIPGRVHQDHRAAAMALVEAMESLGEIIELKVLSQPTFPALAAELARAQSAGRPYHVVHCDSAGDSSGGICFEDPADQQKTDGRRLQQFDAGRIAALLRGHRIALVFLQISETNDTAYAWETLACHLVANGVDSVVAMRPSAVVDTARRLVEVFYEQLADGATVGTAMGAAQRAMLDDPFRIHVAGAGPLQLHDWFTPVLFQGQTDARMFDRAPTRGARDATRSILRARLAALPPSPATGFIGRSRELLTIERALFDTCASHFSIVGSAGEGKTALAVELARWLLRSGRFERVACVSVEYDGSCAAVLNAMSSQLITASSPTIATPRQLEPPLREVERALRERPTLVIIDNMESLFANDFTQAALETDARLLPLLALTERLNTAGATRFIFTSRTPLNDTPGVYPLSSNTLTLGRLVRDDARDILKRMLYKAGAVDDSNGRAGDRLLDAVQCHARTLACLADPLGSGRSLENIVESIEEMMADLHRRFPDSRERSVFASVALSLQRMEPDTRRLAQGMAAFRVTADLAMFSRVADCPIEAARTLGDELCRVGLAAHAAPNRLRLDPALAPFLRSEMDTAVLAALSMRWLDIMQELIHSLYTRHLAQSEQTHAIVEWELPNLLEALACLDRDAHGPPDATIHFCMRMQTLISFLNRTDLGAKLQPVMARAQARSAPEWLHVQFEAAYLHVYGAIDRGNAVEAEALARQLYATSTQHGERAYPLAEVDLALAALTLGETLGNLCRFEEALAVLQDARHRFEQIARANPEHGQEGLINTYLKQSRALEALGQVAAATALSAKAIDAATSGGYTSMLAHANLGLARQMSRQNMHELAAQRLNPSDLSEAVQETDPWRGDRMMERMAAAMADLHRERMKLLYDARDIFSRTQQGSGLAQAWYGIGGAHAAAGDLEQAEHAYRQALITAVKGDHDTEATLIELGGLYLRQDRWQDAVAALEQAANEMRGSANGGPIWSNLALAHLRLGNHDEARVDVFKALDAMEPYGYAASPWNAWTILEQIETAAGHAGNAQAARRNAIDALLAYRRNGGEIESESTRISGMVANLMRSGNLDQAILTVYRLRAIPQWQASGMALLDVLDAIIGGGRDPGLANYPGLSCYQACDVLLLLDAVGAGLAGAPAASASNGSLFARWRKRWRGT